MRILSTTFLLLLAAVAGAATPTSTATFTPVLPLSQSPTRTLSRTMSQTQTSTSTPSSTPTATPTRTPTATPTIVSNYSLFKALITASPTPGPAGTPTAPLYLYQIDWTYNNFLGSGASTVQEIIDTLPAGFIFGNAYGWGGPAPSSVSLTGNVLTVRWTGSPATQTGDSGHVTVYGSFSGGQPGETIWNVASILGDGPGGTQTWSAPAGYTFPTGTPTPSPTHTPFLPTSHSPTVTPSATRSFTASPSATPTLFAGGTLTPTPSPTPGGGGATSATLIDDFEAGGSASVDGGTWNTVSSDGGSTTVFLPAPGCHASAYSGRCHGACSGLPAGATWAGLELAYAGGVDRGAEASYSRTLAFNLRTPDAGLTLTVQAYSGTTVYEVDVYVRGTDWNNVTVALPGHQAPGDLPQLALVSGALSWDSVAANLEGLRFIVRQPGAGSLPYDFSLDNLIWGAYPGACHDRVASALGVPLADVDQAYTYGLSEEAAWTVLVIARHCGCHPSEILAWRATLSWGQIAAHYGLTWAALVDETWNLAEAAGMAPDPGGPDDVLRDLRNGPPAVVPVPTVTPYVPVAPGAMPVAGGC